jgi:hypothetical protein
VHTIRGEAPLGWGKPGAEVRKYERPPGEAASLLIAERLGCRGNGEPLGTVSRYRRSWSVPIIHWYRANQIPAIAAPRCRHVADAAPDSMTCCGPRGEGDSGRFRWTELLSGGKP